MTNLLSGFIKYTGSATEVQLVGLLPSLKNILHSSSLKTWDGRYLCREALYKIMHIQKRLKELKDSRKAA